MWITEEVCVEALDAYADTAVSVVELEGELDAADDSWAAQIDTALATGKTQLVIDLRNVTFIDSSVIRGLVLAHKRVSETGWVRLVYTHHLIARVVEICGLTGVFPQFTTVEAALRSAPTRAAAGRRNDG